MTQVKSTTVEVVKSASMDITNLGATSSRIYEEDLHTSHSSNAQIDATFNIAKEKNNHEENVSVDNLVNQKGDCDIDSMQRNSEESDEKNCAVDDKNSCDTQVDKSPSRKKRNPFTFDNNKYENLSQEADYEVPHLKILGRIETEFNFTSMLYINYAKRYLCINCSHIKHILMFYLF